MAVRLTEPELRDDLDGVIAEVRAGETFVISRDGVPIAELRPLAAGRLVRSNVVAAAFAIAGSTDVRRFRTDVDAPLDHDPTPKP